MSTADLRWLQRFVHFQRALLVLERGVRQAQLRELNELEEQGLIQGFAFTHELACNLLKDYLQHQGIRASGHQGIRASGPSSGRAIPPAWFLKTI